MYALLLLLLSLDETVLRTGESINGFPNWQERVIHQWINRARVDPQSELAPCPSGACGEKACYTPVPPLMWNGALNRAARFHADEMRKQSYFAHDSRCSIVPNIDQLYPVACDGSPACACLDGALNCSAGCTSWSGRVGLFGGAPSGEIIVGTAEPKVAFQAWLFENSPNAACAPVGQNLHRWLILKSVGALGAGVTSGAVVDFGGPITPVYEIPSGAHYPMQAESVEVWANWYDDKPPLSATVIVDGKCIPMTLTRGSQTNGAWSAVVAGVGSGCHRYYFSFVDAAGRRISYPATGSLGIGTGSCLDWQSSRTEGSCSPPPATSRRRTVRR